MKKVLVAGYGNILRGDDGLGPFVAEGLKSAKKPLNTCIHVLSLPQLDISMVAELHNADVAIFVDARQDDKADLLLVDPISPSHEQGPSTVHTHSTHCVGISALLTITAKWYGKAPSCYLVQPKGFDFSLGTSISEKGRQAAEHARQAIYELLRELDEAPAA